VVIEQLKRTGNALVSGSELVIALQNESERELALSLYSNPDKGRLHAIPYSDMKHTTAYEIERPNAKSPTPFVLPTGAILTPRSACPRLLASFAFSTRMARKV